MFPGLLSGLREPLHPDLSPTRPGRAGRGSRFGLPAPAGGGSEQAEVPGQVLGQQ